MWMIDLAANPGPFFMWVNPNAAVFTPHLNKIRDWNSRLFYLHQYLLVSVSPPVASTIASHDGATRTQ
jgi:hypothetical protein